MLLIYVNQNIGYFCDEMIFNFYKYHGTGNDFIIIYGEHYVPSFSKENIIKLCDRKYGIGADGVMLIKYHEDYDFEMQFYNPDGSSSFCGNGSRCAVLFCFHNGICTKKSEILAKFDLDGVSSRIGFFNKLLEETRIRLHNKQNFLFVTMLVLAHSLNKLLNLIVKR